MTKVAPRLRAVLRGWADKLTAIRRGEAVRGVLAIGGGTVTGQLLVVALSPILTRLYTPEEFGVLGLYAAITAVIAILSSLRYEQAIPVAEREEVVDLVSLSFLLIGFAAVLSLVVVGVMARTSALIPSEYTGMFLVFVPLGVFTAGLYQLLSSLAVRDEAYRLVGRTKVLQGLSLSIVQVGAGFVGAGPVGLILGDLTGRGGGVGVYHNLISKRWKDFATVTKRGILKIGRVYKDYPRHIGVATALSSASLYLPYLALQGLFGAKYVGMFVLVQRVVGAPASLVGRSVASVYFGRASAARRDGKSVRSYFVSGMGALAVVGLPLALFGIWAVMDGFRYAFGAEWEEAGLLAAILIPSQLVATIVVPFSQTFNLFGRLVGQKIVDSVRLILVIVAFSISLFLGLGAVATIVLYSIALSAAYSLQGLSMYILVNRLDSRDD